VFKITTSGAVTMLYNFCAQSAPLLQATNGITATVPAGAHNGNIWVVTPSGTLLSNAPFQVLP
jgi:hypothetical protein